MKNSPIESEIQNLRSEIEKHRVAYHVFDKPTIKDEVYDSLMKRLVDLEEKYPEYDSPNSPSKRVGGEPLENFSKVRHEFLQWSYDNVFDYTSLKKWEERNLKILSKVDFGGGEDFASQNPPTYFAELKIDGLKVILTYKDGELFQAATRGDGEYGEDVTENIRTIKTIPLFIENKNPETIVGEVWMANKDFEKINKDRQKEGLELYANPRNVAAGTLRQLDPKVVAKRNLKFFAYDILTQNIDQNKKNEILKSYSFLVNDKSKYCKDISQVQMFYEIWNGEKRFNEEYGIDGVVVKINENKYCKVLGYTAKSPRFGIAYKFEAEVAVTKILDVTYQVGRTGVVTPVAELEPVQLSGSTVRRATLHNFDEIERLGVKIGDSVSVRKAGDIIPQVFDVLVLLRTGHEKKISQIKNCPVCKSILEKDIEGGGVKLICKNEECEEKLISRIIYFASKKCANIEDLGENTLRLFYSLGLVKSVSDIYKLKYSDMEGLEGFKEKSINNILSSIEKSRTQKLERFVVSLSINGVGEETATDFAKHFKTFDAFRNAKKEDLQKIYGIGDKTVEEILSWQKNKKVQREVDEILKYVTVSDYVENLTSKKLENLRFVITGTFEDFSREEIQKLIRENGGEVQSAINKKTSYLIVGVDGGSKVHKAEELGIKQINISEFKNLL